MRLFHVNPPGFKIPCRINECQRSYTNLRSYQNHVSSVHNWVKDDELMLVEEKCLPANGKSWNHSNNNSDDNDENHTGSYEVFDYPNHEKPDSASEIPSYSQEMLQKSVAIFYWV